MITSGISSSQKITNATHADDDERQLVRGVDADRVRNQRRRGGGDQAEQGRSGMNSSSGSSRKVAERVRAVAALGDEPERQPHQRAERGFEGAEIDRGEGRGERAREGSSADRVDQPFAQPALTAELALDALHAPVVVLVIVPQQVQQTMQREHPQLGASECPASRACRRATPARDGDFAEEAARGRARGGRGGPRES